MLAETIALRCLIQMLVQVLSALYAVKRLLYCEIEVLSSTYQRKPRLVFGFSNRELETISSTSLLKTAHGAKRKANVAVLALPDAIETGQANNRLGST